MNKVKVNQIHDVLVMISRNGNDWNRFMKKILLFSAAVFFSSCQVQINFASNVVNVPVNKTQLSEDSATMTGSILDEVGKGSKMDNKNKFPSPIGSFRR
jgi:hypothetical protein